jgi:hypothetical protein
MAVRLRALPTATPDARFFDGRFFGGRDFDAMIPLTLAGPTMPWPGSVSHAEGSFSPRERPAENRPKLRQADQAADVGRRGAPGAEFAQARGLC